MTTNKRVNEAKTLGTIEIGVKVTRCDAYGTTRETLFPSLTCVAFLSLLFVLLSLPVVFVPYSKWYCQFAPTKSAT